METSDKDLLFMPMVFPVKINVNDVVYDLIGEISSSSEDECEEDVDDELELYLLNPTNYDPQMARTKRTARKQQPQPGTSRGGYQLATR